MQKPLESHARSIVKAALYRILVIITDTVFAYLFTHNVAETAGIVVIMNVYSTVLYYVHERGWAHVSWGTR